MKKTLEDYVIEGNIDEIIKDFKKYLINYNLDELDRSAVLKMYEWFEEEYRPQVIMNNLFKPLKNLNKLSQEYYLKIQEFENICEKFKTNLLKQADQYSELDQKLLQDIFEFIKTSQEIIKYVKIEG